MKKSENADLQADKKPVKVKKSRKDRKDGRWVKEADAMHHFMPYMLPDRTDNEAVINETFDLTEVLKYIQLKNENIKEGEYKYTLFHVITSALAKTIYLRPKLNRFIQGKRLYERDKITFSFIIKKQFVDTAEEGVCILTVGETGQNPIDELFGKIKEQVLAVRQHGKKDGTTDIMEKIVKMPRFIINLIAGVLRSMDYHGTTPWSLMREDPYYTTVFISNLGSIKMSANYHHLANYGTNSFFLVINEKTKTPVYDQDGNVTMRDTINLSCTIDERIADGLYFANSIKLMRKILLNPSVLDLPIETPLD